MTSSTSNSELNHKPRARTNQPNRSRRRFWWGAVWFLLILAVLDLFIFRNDWVYGQAPQSFAGQIVELKKRADAFPLERVEVAIFGDSQSMDGLRPEWLAEDLGLSADSVFNFSLSGGKPLGAWHLYQLYRERLTRLKTAVVVVNEHQFNNRGFADDNEFRYFANLGERLQSGGPWDETADLALGYFWKGYDMRRVWRPLLAMYRKGELPQQVKPYRWGLTPTEWQPPENKSPAYSEQVADRWFKDYDTQGVYTESFARLVSALRRQGVRVMIIQIPRTAGFEEVVAKKYPEQEAAYRHLLEGIAQANGSRFIQWKPGWDNSFFMDANHLNRQGARRATEELARMIRAEGL